MVFRNPTGGRESSGQALVETALVMPLLILVVLNAVNFGYCFLVAVNLSAAPRSGVLYSILGFSTPGTLTLPSAGPPSTNSTVSYLAYQDLTGAVANPQGASVQVCSEAVGVSATAGTTNCVTCSGGSCSSGSSIASPGADPEPTAFYLQRVDVRYSFSPLIPGRPFGALLPASCVPSGGSVTCTFTRHVSMRAMN
jgi:TadE-like protein